MSSSGGGAPADSRARRTALSIAPRARRPGVPGGGSVACSSAIRPSDGYVPRTTASIPPAIASYQFTGGRKCDRTSSPGSAHCGLGGADPAVRRDRPRPRVGVAAAMAPLLAHFFGGAIPVRFEFWDGTASLGGRVGQRGDTLQVRSPDAVRRLLWAPGELGLARAFVVGDLAFEGDIFEVLAMSARRSPATDCMSGHGCRGRRCRRPAGSGSSASPSRRHPRKRRRRAACTRAVATRRPSSTTTTSATTSTPWSSGPAMTYSCVNGSPRGSRRSKTLRRRSTT